MKWEYGNVASLEAGIFFGRCQSCGRESGVAGHSMTCGVSLPINRNHRVLSIKALYSFC